MIKLVDWKLFNQICTDKYYEMRLDFKKFRSKTRRKILIFWKLSKFFSCQIQRDYIFDKSLWRFLGFKFSQSMPWIKFELYSKNSWIKNCENWLNFELNLNMNVGQILSFETEFGSKK
jgi:hypothetical protein